jgi:hypothetical protein
MTATTDDVQALIQTITDAQRQLDKLRPAKIAEHLDALKALEWDGLAGMDERGWGDASNGVSRTRSTKKVAKTTGKKKRRRRSGEEKAKAIEAGIKKVVAALHGAKKGKKAELLSPQIGHDWNEVVKAALARKAIRKTGKKRATIYFAVTGKK